ncbi:PAS domain S-box protein [bacterium]|nr:PAS domain S-box protein [bacterium]
MAEQKDKIKALKKKIDFLKKENKKLNELKERFKAVFDFAPDPYYLSDLKGNFIDGNKAAEKMIGAKKEKLTGKSFLKLKMLPAEELPKAVSLLAKNALGMKTGPEELTLNTIDGRKIQVEASNYPIKLGGRTVVLGIVRDITERKKREEELRLKNDELKKFNKIAVGRELKMIELKKKVEALEKQISELKKNNK